MSVRVRADKELEAILAERGMAIDLECKPAASGIEERDLVIGVRKGAQVTFKNYSRAEVFLEPMARELVLLESDLSAIEQRAENLSMSTNSQSLTEADAVRLARWLLTTDSDRRSSIIQCLSGMDIETVSDREALDFVTERLAMILLDETVTQVSDIDLG